MTASLRPPAVAGTFYPSSPQQLAQDVRILLGSAHDPFPRRPKIIIAPHAGYIYSGSTAAQAYAPLAPWREQIRRVVLLGPTHRVAVHGIALPSVDFFATPLGAIAIDRDAVTTLDPYPQILVSDAAHAQEHSLEVHLPFLQTVLEDFSLVPLAVGHTAPEMVAQILDALWGGDETLIVISTDLSHFLPYARSNDTDQATCQRILALESDIRPEEACGAFPVNGVLLTARHRGMQIRQLARCNSGDTAGDKNRVVGYAAFALYESEADHG